MYSKLFSQRLNQALDAIDFPIKQDERIEAFAKLFKLPSVKADMILNGNLQPDSELLQAIATELEVQPEWLLDQHHEDN